MKQRDPLGETASLDRREVLSFAAWAAAAMTLGARAARAQSSAPSFVDQAAAMQIADRDPALRPPLLVDMQTHVWWRADGPRSLTERGSHFLKSLAGARAGVLGRPVPIADMGRVMFFEDVLLESQTDVAFLNSFGMKAAFDGVDLFPPREAALIRSMAPSRVRVLGTVDPPDGASAVDSLSYQCEALKIDGLKLYPPGPDTRGWRMDDEKATYPLYEILRKHGVRNICVHKGVPGLFLAEYCHTDDLARAAADFPDLNFIAYHSAIPWEAELAEHGRRSRAKNIYAELGTTAFLIGQYPDRYAKLIGTLLAGLGPDNILWGTDTPVIGPPQWQIEAFQSFVIPDEVRERFDYPPLTREVKEKILGGNAARLFGLDIAATRRAVEDDFLFKLRDDGNAPAHTVDWRKVRLPISFE
jgi:predicted TIM-barrel fold metal-dependent hydrolase